MRLLIMVLCLTFIGCATGQPKKMNTASTLTMESTLRQAPFGSEPQGRRRGSELSRTAEEDSPQAIVKNVQNIVFLYARNNDGTIHGCATGFVVDKDGIIATARHVVRATRGLRLFALINENGKITIRRALGSLSHPDADVSLLHVNHEFKSAITLRVAPLLPNEKLFTIGFPMALRFEETPLTTSATLSSGNFFKSIRVPVRFSKERERIIFAHLPIAKGSSGGVIFDRYGRAVGLISGTTKEQDPRSYVFSVIVPAFYIKSLLVMQKMFPGTLP